MQIMTWLQTKNWEGLPGLPATVSAPLHDLVSRARVADCHGPRARAQGYEDGDGEVVYEDDFEEYNPAEDGRADVAALIGNLHRQLHSDKKGARRHAPHCQYAQLAALPRACGLLVTCILTRKPFNPAFP